jgi:Tfp pilus assembly protein FimT
MKQLTKMRNTSGNSLAEFAVVIALMATLMSTGQVKFSQAGEGGKGKKTGEELDKISKAARNFYNAMNDEEGAGRFPGQDKWDRNVPGYEKPSDKNVFGDGRASDDLIDMGDEKGYSTVVQAVSAITTNMKSYTSFTTAAASESRNWTSVFGKDEPGFKINYTHFNKIAADDGNDKGKVDSQKPWLHDGPEEFGSYLDPVKSPFLDGHFIYTVIGGTGSREPAFIVTDFYAPADEFVVVQP